MAVVQFQATMCLNRPLGCSDGRLCFARPHHFLPERASFPNAALQIATSRTNASIAKSTVTLCSTQSQSQTPQELSIVKEKSVSVVLLAGGQGKRMGANMPKQYLPLLGQPIALYSFYTFSRMVEVKEIIVVCDPSYKDIFEDAKVNDKVELKFALPGKERQDSVYNGLQECAVYFSFFC